jgi:hypothetical protein
MKTNDKLKETIHAVVTDISDEIICRVDWVDRYTTSVLTVQSHGGHIQIGALINEVCGE